MAIYQGSKKLAYSCNVDNSVYAVPIGTILSYSVAIPPVGFLVCDGSEVSKTTYADLFEIIGDTYGTATDTSKFKLPDLRDRFVQGANGNLGTSKDAGLPNITGKFYHDTNAKAGLSGAFTYEGTGRQNLANDTPANSGLITFDASKSNSIYGNSNTVQPPSVCLTFIIKALKVSDKYAEEVGVTIDDSSTSADKTWSSQKINTAVDNLQSSISTSQGRNLIPYPLTNRTTNGITYTVQSDGSVLANGTASAENNAYYNFAYKTLKLGVNNDGVGTWSEQHIKGYEDYKNNGRDYEWYRLDPNTVFCLTSCPDDEFYAPLPFFLPLFELILDDIDLQELINNRTALENYVLLVSKIPTVPNSENVDDFSLSLELVQQMQALIDEVVPELVGTAYSPMDLEMITFPKSNTTEANNELAQSVQNIFANAGASQLVISGGSSTNSVGLKHAIQNDTSTCWVLVNKIESWYNHYIKNVLSDGYSFKIHKITWYNQEEYQSAMKDAATLGGSALDYLTSLMGNPYEAYCKLTFENAIGIKNLMIPLQTSFTQSNKKNSGGQTKNIDDLSDSGIETRDNDKNAGTSANN